MVVFGCLSPNLLPKQVMLELNLNTYNNAMLSYEIYFRGGFLGVFTFLKILLCISIIPMIFILCFRFFLIHFGGRTHKIFMRLSGCKINLLLQGRNKKCVSTECCWGRFYNLHVYQRQRHVCGALLICVHLYTHTYTCKFKANKKSPQKWRTEKKYIQNGW